MERKSDKVRQLVKAGEYKKALAIAKKFVIGISKDEQSAMTRAYECMNYPQFYCQLGIDPEGAINEGVAVLKRLYG